MYSVLLQEEPVQATAEESSSFQVDVTVLVTGPKSSDVSFEPKKADNYMIEAQSILLIGSGGSPREFVVTFTLSAESQQAKYTFCNPALKFFQGDGKTAGFRVGPNPDLVSATVTLFNTKRAGDPPVSDEFSLLFVNPATQQCFSHDPSIVWDPPNG